MTPADPAAGWKRLLVQGDERGSTSAHGEYAAFASLWVPWERRGDLLRVTRAAGEGVPLIDEVFRRRWIAVRAVVVPLRGEALEGATAEAAFASMIASRLSSLPGGLEGRELKVRTSRAEGASSERLGRIGRAIEASANVPASMQRSIRPSRGEEALAIASLFARLIANAWERRGHPDPLAQRIAENLGWADLGADTLPSEWKLNVALHRAPGQAQRAVQLRLPLVD